MLYSTPVINWFSVFINSFWIVGLAILLASFSYHYWLAGEDKQPLRSLLNGASFLKPFWLSLVFIGLGLAGTSQRPWEIAIWTFFTLLSLYNLFTLSKTH